MRPLSTKQCTDWLSFAAKQRCDGAGGREPRSYALDICLADSLLVKSICHCSHLVQNYSHVLGPGPVSWAAAQRMQNPAVRRHCCQRAEFLRRVSHKRRLQPAARPLWNWEKLSACLQKTLLPHFWIHATLRRFAILRHFERRVGCHLRKRFLEISRSFRPQSNKKQKCPGGFQTVGKTCCWTSHKIRSFQFGHYQRIICGHEWLSWA